MPRSELTVGRTFKVELPRNNTEIHKFREYEIVQVLNNMVLCQEKNTKVKESFSFWDISNFAIW